MCWPGVFVQYTWRVGAPVSRVGRRAVPARNSLAKFTCGITGQPTRHATSGAARHLRKWGKLSQKTEDYHILIKRSRSTSPGSAQPTRQRDAALACNSQAPLSSETFTPIKVKLVLPPSQYPTRADLTTIPMTEVEELLPGGDRQSR